MPGGMPFSAMKPATPAAMPFISALSPEGSLHNGTANRRQPNQWREVELWLRLNRGEAM